MFPTGISEPSASGSPAPGVAAGSSCFLFRFLCFFSFTLASAHARWENPGACEPKASVRGSQHGHACTHDCLEHERTRGGIRTCDCSHPRKHLSKHECILRSHFRHHRRGSPAFEAAVTVVNLRCSRLLGMARSSSPEQGHSFMHARGDSVRCLVKMHGPRGALPFFLGLDVPPDTLRGVAPRLPARATTMCSFIFIVGRARRCTGTSSLTKTTDFNFLFDENQVPSPAPLNVLFNILFKRSV